MANRPYISLAKRDGLDLQILVCSPGNVPQFVARLDSMIAARLLPSSFRNFIVLNPRIQEEALDMARSRPSRSLDHAATC